MSEATSSYCPILLRSSQLSELGDPSVSAGLASFDVERAACPDFCDGPVEITRQPIETPLIPVVGRVITAVAAEIGGPTQMVCPRQIEATE